MAIIVQKYGGSSVADVAKIQRVADKVVETVRRGHQVVVVVSAMAKTTDGLLELAQSAATVDGQRMPPARRELDMLVTTGERVSMALLSIAIRARGCDAISFTGSQCGILTNHRHFDARIIEVRPHRVEDELAKGRVVIVAGYQGVSYKREITTLGRGGSDTTAVALAAALNAERCEIYSDVDGVYTADPRVVADARHIDEIDAQVLQQMAESGAKVLNAQAVQWARREGIAIYARASFGPTGPDGEPCRETIVRSNPPHQDNRVRAITCDNNVALVCLETSAKGDMEAAIKSLAKAAIPMRGLTATPSGLALIIALNNVPDWERTRQVMLADSPWKRATVHGDVALVSVVGDGLSQDATVVSRALAVLSGDATVSDGHEPAGPKQIEVLSWMMTALWLGMVVPREHSQLAQRRLSTEFVKF